MQRLQLRVRVVLAAFSQLSKRNRNCSVVLRRVVQLRRVLNLFRLLLFFSFEFCEMCLQDVEHSLRALLDIRFDLEPRCRFLCGNFLSSLSMLCARESEKRKKSWNEEQTSGPCSTGLRFASGSSPSTTRFFPLRESAK